MNEAEVKWHYYWISYETKNSCGDFYQGQDRKEIRLAEVNKAKAYAREMAKEEAAVLTSWTYLGYMTKEEFLDET